MFLEELDQAPSKIPGTGPRTLEALAGVGVFRISELFAILPRSYEDRSQILPFSRVREAGGIPIPVLSAVEVLSHSYFGSRGNLKIKVRDASSQASLLCFGRAFLVRNLRVGSFFFLSGVFSFRYAEIQASSFETEPIPADILPQWKEWIASSGAPLGLADSPKLPQTRQFGRVLPRYPNLAGLGAQKIRSILDRAIDLYLKSLEDPLPAYLQEERKLLDLNRSLEDIHRPQRIEDVSPARRRMAYQELFFLQLGLARQAVQRKREGLVPESNPGQTHQETETASQKTLLAGIRSSLGFELTGDQDLVLKEILEDLSAPGPMSRLLQGDVGSGKTILAFLAAADIAAKGGQAVLMAPTELLARQHAAKADEILGPHGIRVAFLAGALNQAPRRILLDELKKGSIDLLVGTHAVFTADLEFKNLRLALVDEQHRFGVNQREALLAKGEAVHLLLMSATPIPRTLAMTVYGDLEISTLKEKPPGRKAVATHLAKMGNEGKVYRFVEEELKKGRQAYFVYPRILEVRDEDLGEGEYDRPEGQAQKTKNTGGIKSALESYEFLRDRVYPGYRVGLIHGQMKEAEKIQVMEEFVSGKIQVLVSTTVVEVGVDVGNASCMVIEHAERFGLAALHQLRGRVGRSSVQAYCFLVYKDPLTELGKERLKILKETDDGFKIAEKDLELRGPGDIQGFQQSGFLQLRYADLGRDMELMNLARKDAFALLEKDPELTDPEHEVVRRYLEVLERIPRATD